MTDNRFHHHPYLQRVADEDVRYVLAKDTSYGASWKASGGVNAWFMLKRKIDRMVEMMKKPEDPPGWQDADTWVRFFNGSATPQEIMHLAKCYRAGNIFAAIRSGPSGDDGTVLAEVRDLRRYLLLVEAEMMARGVVAAPAAPLPEVTEDKPDQLDEIMQQVELLVGELPDLAGVRHAVARGAIRRLRDMLFHPEELPDPPPATRLEDLPHNSSDADSSRHASLVPFAVSMRWRFKHDMQPGGKREATFENWYRCTAPGTWVLEEAVSAANVQPPAPIYPYYTKYASLRDVPQFWVLNVAMVPPELRAHYPVLRHEINAAEFAGLPPWQQLLYTWTDERTGNYVLQVPAWQHQPEEAA